MQMLRKKGTTEPTWPFHAMLAMRPDIESFDDGRPEKSTAHVVDVVRTGDPQATGLKAVINAKVIPAPPVDVDAITDKAQLRKLCLEYGVKVAGNPSLFTLQSLLKNHFKGAA